MSWSNLICILYVTLLLLKCGIEGAKAIIEKALDKINEELKDEEQ